MNYSVRIANEVRVEMARQRTPIVGLVAKTGIPRSRLYRKLSGQVPFDTNELDQVASALNLTPSVFACRAEATALIDSIEVSA